MAEMREITTGLQFPEGPVCLADGSVLLVEIRRGKDRVGTVSHIGAVEIRRQFAFDLEIERLGFEHGRSVDAVQVRIVDVFGPAGSVRRVRSFVGGHANQPIAIAASASARLRRLSASRANSGRIT